MKVLSLFIKYQKRALITIDVLLIFGGGGGVHSGGGGAYNREDICVPELGAYIRGGGVHSGAYIQGGVLSGVYGMLQSVSNTLQPPKPKKSTSSCTNTKKM